MSQTPEVSSLDNCNHVDRFFRIHCAGGGERMAGRRAVAGLGYRRPSRFAGPAGRRMVDEKKVAHDGSITRTIQLEKNSLCMLELIPAAD